MSAFDNATLMITGGTGSFGSTVLKHFLDSDLKEIRIFSRDEKKQDDMRHELQAKHPENAKKVKFYIGDVRNPQSIRDAMPGVDYIFHAAALKQVPSCEFFPMQAVQTNIIGTDNVLHAAIDAGVKRVVCLSTDKAAYPINAMGISKAILYIYGCYMKEHGELMNNTVVTTVMSNFGLYKAFDEQGIGYAKTAVGDKYVYEYMAKNGCRIGGEQSGHIIFSKYASTGDGILTSLKMMEVMLAKKMPMSKLAEPLKIYPQVLENVRVTDKKAAQNDPAVQEAVKAVAEALGDTGRILVRESGTEPVVRVMVEAPDHDTCQKYVSQVVEVIKNKGYGV